ncbi:armadillo-type protein [Mycena rosella]|uniref:Armadillo-type protein n=1 Tax=Mycena rosella TaxID=1033263 RepID=A0AAD7H280_MYCRO|nr:armadillo-type protein [Mycena rosella]
MPPLTRQRTLESILSWWSDSNPPGPTISLHAASKPLMRYMYRRQAADFIAKTQGTAFSLEQMHIYSSYLSCKYVSAFTKSIILAEIQTRIIHEERAPALVADSLLYLVHELCGSRAAQVRRLICWILGQLAIHHTTAEAVIHMNLSSQLVSLLSDRDSKVVENTLWALNCVATTAEGAAATVNANVLGVVIEFLDSSVPFGVRDWTAELLGKLTRHEVTRAAVLRVTPCAQLVFLLRDVESKVVEDAARELTWIAGSAEGAAAAVNANVLGAINELLDSPSSTTGVRDWACQLVTELGWDETTRGAVFTINPCARLASLSQWV